MKEAVIEQLNKRIHEKKLEYVKATNELIDVSDVFDEKDSRREQIALRMDKLRREMLALMRAVQAMGGKVDQTLASFLLSQEPVAMDPSGHDDPQSSPLEPRELPPPER